MVEPVTQDIRDLLSSVFNEKLENLKIEVDGEKISEGGLGEILFILIKNKKTTDEHRLAIKQTPNSDSVSTINKVSKAYCNEIHFYTQIIPSLIDFQRDMSDVDIFDDVPTCYGVDKETGKEKIVFENLKSKNYELHPKSIPLNTKMYEAIFKMYGRFHGLSYAFKHYQPKKFLEVVEGFSNSLLGFTETDFFATSIKRACTIVDAILEQGGEKKMAKKFKKYVDNGLEILRDAALYKSPYAVIVHGDAWSNNMMFKFNEAREVTHIKMLDFQVSMFASPILDLAYSLYSGAAKETLDNLESLLCIYYHSLRSTLEKYKCDPEKILPYAVLKKEWKELVGFSLMVSLLVLSVKSKAETKMPKVVEMMDSQTKDECGFIHPNELKFKELVLVLLKHLDENDFL